jgi:hypothetical protein
MKRGGAVDPDTGAGGTIRERMRAVLREGPATARDLSRRLGVPEREIADHLEHLARSLRHGSERLVMEPPACLACGFAFRGRTRPRRPSHCPRCRSRRITLPRFHVEQA